MSRTALRTIGTFALGMGVLAGSGCGNCGGGGARVVDAGRLPVRPPNGHGDPVVEPPRRPVGHVTTLEGDATVTGAGGGAPRRPGETFDLGAQLRTGTDGQLVVDFREDARLTLYGDSIGQIGTFGPATLSLARGSVRANLPPAGNSYRPPLRVATPEAVIDIGASGDLLISVHPSGATWVAVFSGSASVTRGDRAEDTTSAARTVTPGRTILVAATLPDEPVPGPRTLDAARLIPPVLWRGRAPEIDAARRAADLTALDAALAALAVQKGRSADLATRQRAAMRISPTAAADVQREIVAHSGELYRARVDALVRWDRAQAAALAVGAAGEAEVAPRRRRVEELLGRFVP